MIHDPRNISFFSIKTCAHHHCFSKGDVFYSCFFDYQHKRVFHCILFTHLKRLFCDRNIFPARVTITRTRGTPDIDWFFTCESTFVNISNNILILIDSQQSGHWFYEIYRTIPLPYIYGIICQFQIIINLTPQVIFDTVYQEILLLFC